MIVAAVADLDFVAARWLDAMASACWQGGAALLLAWMVCRAWRSLPPRVACWFWRLAYLKLLVALVWTAPLRLPLLAPPTASVAITAANTAAPVRNDGPQAAAFPPSVEQAPPPVPGRSPAAPPWSLARLLLIAWLVGVIVMVARMVVAFIRALRLRRRCRAVTDDGVRQACAELASRFGLRRTPPLLTCDGLPGPLLLGLVRPAVVLPSPVAEAPSGELRQVIAHELAHLRRRDLAWNGLVAIADALFFFHPALWLARREYRVAQEAACDEAALAATQSAPADYARTLLAVAAKGSLPAVAFSAGVIGSRRNLERRILAMTRRSNWSRARRVVAAAVVVVSAVAALPPWRVVAQEKPAEKPAGEASKESIKPGTADPLVEKLRARREAEAAAPPGGPAPGQPANGGRGQRSSFNGNVVAETLDLRAPGDGVVVRLGVRSGERVKQGALIVEFDAQRAKAGLAQAEAKLALAESQLKRVRLMVDAQHAAAASEVEEKQANLQMAKAEIDLRRQDLQETQIRAPFDGAVELTAREGLRVTKGEALGRVIAVDAPRVAFVAPVAAIRELTVGRPVEVGLTAYPDRTFKAEISDVSPIVDPASGTLSVYARITEKAAGVLPGMYARVTLRGPDAPPSAPQQ